MREGGRREGGGRQKSSLTISEQCLFTINNHLANQITAKCQHVNELLIGIHVHRPKKCYMHPHACLLYTIIEILLQMAFHTWLVSHRNLGTSFQMTEKSESGE